MSWQLLARGGLRGRYIWPLQNFSPSSNHPRKPEAPELTSEPPKAPEAPTGTSEALEAPARPYEASEAPKSPSDVP